MADHPDLEQIENGGDDEDMIQFKATHNHLEDVNTFTFTVGVSFHDDLQSPTYSEYMDTEEHHFTFDCKGEHNCLGENSFVEDVHYEDQTIDQG